MIEISYRNIPVGAKENSTNNFNNVNSISDISLLNEFDVEASKMGTMEKNYLALNGEFDFRDNDSIIPYISENISDENGEFTNDIVLTRTYDNVYSSPRN